MSVFLYNTTRRLITPLSVLLFILCSTSIVYGAEQYQPIVGIPGLTNDTTRDLGSFFNAAYVVLISLGALAAVIKIAIAGFKYSLSDIVTSKSEAKSDIYGALLGLAILLIPYIVLNEINPNLTNINVLGGAAPLNLTSTQNTPVGATLGEGSNSSPTDRDALIRSCPNDLRTTSQNSYCCASSEYTGAYKCQNTATSQMHDKIGLDTTKVYAPGEIEELLRLRPQSSVIVIGVTTRPNQAAADCSAALTGSSPILLDQAGGSTVGVKRFDKVLVCAK